MKKIIFHLLIIFSLETFAQQSKETITIQNNLRDYYKYLPVNFDSSQESLPLILFLHGLEGTALETSHAGFNDIADTARFICLYLQGAKNELNITSWNNGTLLQSKANDLLFISNIIDSIIVKHNIDISRIYMAGISMGAIMTYKAIRHLNHKIAAVSCYIGTMSDEEISNYQPLFPVPIQHVHGTEDDVVPYEFKISSLSTVPQTILKLKETNNCNSDSIIIDIPDTKDDGITIEKIIYSCETHLELLKMNGAKHIFLSESKNDTSGAILSWLFLKKHTHLNPNPVATTSSQEVSKIEFHPNPAINKLFIKEYSQLKEISIYDVNGTAVLNTSSIDGTLDLSSLKKGLYIIQFTTNDDHIINEKLVIK